MALNYDASESLDRSKNCFATGDSCSLVERMADTMITQCAEGYCSNDTLIEAGFTAQELAANSSAARKVANAKFVRQSDTPAYNRPLRLALARLAIAEALPGKQYLVTELQARSFTKSEIDDLLNEAITLAADDFATVAMGTVQ